MVILHDATKTMQNGVFVFFFRTKTCFLSNNPKQGLKKQRKQVGWIFLNPDYLSILFRFFSWSHNLQQVTSLSVWLGVRRTPRVRVPGIEEAENYWHLNM